MPDPSHGGDRSRSDGAALQVFAQRQLALQARRETIVGSGALSTEAWQILMLTVREAGFGDRAVEADVVRSLGPHASTTRRLIALLVSRGLLRRQGVVLATLSLTAKARKALDNYRRAEISEWESGLSESG